MITQIKNIKVWIINHQYIFIKYVIIFLKSLVILLLGLVCAKFIKKIVVKFISFRNFDKTINEFLSIIIYYSINIIILITVLNQIGIETTSIITLLGASGLAIGLALQSSLSNFAAGIILIFFRPLQVGEFVIINNHKGIVEHIQFFFTTLRNSSNHMIAIPNSIIINNNIINVTRFSNRRIQIIIGVAYNADIKLVKSIFKKVIMSDSRIQHDKEILIRLDEIASSSLNFVIRVWTTNQDAKNVYWDLIENFKNQLDINNIAIPYKQVDVHLHQKI
nr:MAG: small-conductance mechanosensitive channel MscS [Candidatus Aschnera chinzeii]